MVDFKFFFDVKNKMKSRALFTQYSKRFLLFRTLAQFTKFTLFPIIVNYRIFTKILITENWQYRHLKAEYLYFILTSSKVWLIRFDDRKQNIFISANQMDTLMVYWNACILKYYDINWIIWRHNHWRKWETHDVCPNAWIL